MKISKRTRTLAAVTAAAMLTTFITSVPAISAETEQRVSVTLEDWSQTLTYTDIPQAEYKTTEITIKPDWKGTVSFSDVDPDQDPQLRQLYNKETDSGGYGFDIWNNRADLVSAIEAKDGVKLTDASPIKMTDISVAYSWNLTTTDEEYKYIQAWPHVWGLDANGSEPGCGDLSVDSFDKTGSAVFSTAESTDSGVQAIEYYNGFSLSVGALSNNPDDTLDVTVDSLTISVQYSVTGNGGWKSTYDGGNTWDFSTESDMFIELLDAIEKQTGSRPESSSVQINDISADFSWDFKTEQENPGVLIMSSTGGTNGDEKYDLAIPDDKTDYLFTGKTGSGSISAKKVTAFSGVEITDYEYMNIAIGAWTDNPEDTLTLSLSNITFDVTCGAKNNADNGNTVSVTLPDWSETLTYTDIGEDGGWKSTYDGDNTWNFFKEFDDGTLSDMFTDVLDAIEEQTGSRPESSSVKINDISADFSWDFKTEQENPGVLIMSSTGGTNGDKKYDLNIPNDKKDYQFTGKTGSGSISANKVTALSGVEITDYAYMNIAIGAWTCNPEDTLTLSLSNITFDVTVNSYSDDYPRIYMSYDDLKDAKYVKIEMEVSTKDSCGHKIDHIGDDGVKYYDDWTYCPWAGIEIKRISADGTASDNAYYALTEQPDCRYSYSAVALSDIYAEVGELAEGEQLEFCGYDCAAVTKVTAMNSLPLMYAPESIDELTIEQGYDWDEESQTSVPTGKPEIVPTLQICNYMQKKSLKGYAAIAVDYTLLNPNACSALTVILQGWEEDSVGWDARYYAVEGKSGRIIIDLSDLQEKTFHNVYVGVVAQPTAQIGDTFAPCFTVTNAELLTSCTETATAEIDPIEPIDPPETDEYGRKTVNFTLNPDWERTIDFTGVSEGHGDYRILYDEATESGHWVFDKNNNNGNVRNEIIKAIYDQTGEYPVSWPVIFNDITVEFEWEFNTDSDYTEVDLYPFVHGTTDDDSWIDTKIPDNGEIDLYEKKGSYTISASRTAVLYGAEDLTDFYTMSLNLGTYSEDPNASLTVRIKSVKINASYTPKKAIYLTYDELKDAQAIKVYYNKSDRNDCGHGYDHIADDGIDYNKGMVYCPWSDIEIRRISADGTISDAYFSGPDEYNDNQSVTVTKKLSEITATVGELSEGDKLEFAGNPTSTVTDVELLDSMPDFSFKPISIGEITIEEACDWYPTGEVPNGDVEIRYYGEALISSNPIFANEYSAIKLNYTLENPDDCSAIVVVIQGWNDSYVDGVSTDWVEKHYPVSGNSGTIVIDLSEFGDKYFFNVLVGIVARADVNIGDKINPGFKMTDGALMINCTDPASREIPRVLSVVNSIKFVNEIVLKTEESDDPYILSYDELAAIEAVLDYDYSK